MGGWGVHPSIEWRSIRGPLGSNGLGSSEGYLAKRGWYPTLAFRGSFELRCSAIDCLIQTNSCANPLEGKAHGARRSLTDVLLLRRLKKRFMNFSGFSARADPLYTCAFRSSLAARREEVRRTRIEPPLPLPTMLQTCFETWSKARTGGSQRDHSLRYALHLWELHFLRETEIKEWKKCSLARFLTLFLSSWTLAHARAASPNPPECLIYYVSRAVNVAFRSGVMRPSPHFVGYLPSLIPTTFVEP